MIGIVPAAGLGSRIQPLAFSKELLPVGSWLDGNVERPKAVSEYLVERMALAGAARICFVIAATKSDIVEYYGADAAGAHASYVVQPEPLGLCDAIFRALPLVRDDEDALIGLPDTVWFPEHGFTLLPEGGLSFLLFPVEKPELFDAVSIDPRGFVEEIEVKQPRPRTRFVWGAIRASGRVLRELRALWLTREPRDLYLGTLVNCYLGNNGVARAVTAGEDYVDVGTLGGYREAIRLLQRKSRRLSPTDRSRI